MCITTGLVRLPEGTDIIASWTDLNWPLPSVATTISIRWGVLFVSRSAKLTDPANQISAIAAIDFCGRCRFIGGDASSSALPGLAVGDDPKRRSRAQSGVSRILIDLF